MNLQPTQLIPNSYPHLLWAKMNLHDFPYNYNTTRICQNNQKQLLHENAVSCTDVSSRPNWSDDKASTPDTVFSVLVSISLIVFHEMINYHNGNTIEFTSLSWVSIPSTMISPSLAVLPNKYSTGFNCNKQK